MRTGDNAYRGGDLTVTGNLYVIEDTTLNKKLIIKDPYDSNGDYIECQIVMTVDTSAPYSLLASDAAAGQKNVTLADASSFTAGDQVKIRDSASGENCEIDSIDGNTLTLVNNLANSYTTAAGAAVGTFNPILKITEAFWGMKDAYYEGFIGTASPANATGGGAISIGSRLTDPDDPPRINLTDDADAEGTGCTAHAHITDGAVTSIDVDNGGSGYTSAPTIVLTGGTPTAHAVVLAHLTGDVVSSIEVVDGGSGYSEAPTVTVNSGKFDTLYLCKSSMLSSTVTRSTLNTHPEYHANLSAGSSVFANVYTFTPNTAAIGTETNYFKSIYAAEGYFNYPLKQVDGSSFPFRVPSGAPASPTTGDMWIV